MSKEESKIKHLFEASEIQIQSDSIFAGDKLSFVGEDSETGDFIVTLDKLIEENLAELCVKVLSIKGFSENLENMLASLDQAKFGLRVESTSEEVDRISNYTYCMSIPSPSKNIQGPLLNKFYVEIQSYQKKLLDLKKETDKKEAQRKTQTVTELREENKKLKMENINLKDQVKELNTKLEKALINTIQIKPESIPSGIEKFRVARVTHIDLYKKTIELKSDKNAFSFPMKKLSVMPKLNTKCLVHFLDGIIVDLFFYDGNIEKLDLVLAHVVTVSTTAIKIRDVQRNLLIIELKTREDYDQARQLTRNLPIVIFKYQNVTIKWEKLANIKKSRELVVQEEFYRQEISKRVGNG